PSCWRTAASALGGVDDRYLTGERSLRHVEREAAVLQQEGLVPALRRSQIDPAVRVCRLRQRAGDQNIARQLLRALGGEGQETAVSRLRRSRLPQRGGHDGDIADEIVYVPLHQLQYHRVRLTLGDHVQADGHGPGEEGMAEALRQIGVKQIAEGVPE